MQEQEKSYEMPLEFPVDVFHGTRTVEVLYFGNTVRLSFEQVARIYGMMYPEAQKKCTSGCPPADMTLREASKKMGEP
jgi:hypothetical protein